MVVLFSNRNNKIEKELIEILTACGADYISDKQISATGGFFTVVSFYKTAELNIKKGIALILDDTEKYYKQTFANDFIGICEDINVAAIKIFEKNSIPVITYGNNHKNTITVSSMEDKELLITLQRKLKNIYGEDIYPADYKITLKKPYLKETVMCAATILLLNGKEPKKF